MYLFTRQLDLLSNGHSVSSLKPMEFLEAWSWAQGDTAQYITLASFPLQCCLQQCAHPSIAKVVCPLACEPLLEEEHYHQ